jgi:hypothetical protein
VADEDLESLESFLDGALEPAEAERVARRVALDSAWGRALDQLRSEQAVRREVWQSLEPDAAAAESAGSAAIQSARSADRWSGASRVARRASAVAAGLLVAFAGGWFARGRAPAPAAPIVPPPIEIQVALTDEGGRIIAVQHFSDPREAREFAEDVGRWQSGRRQGDSGDFSQVSDEF